MKRSSSLPYLYHQGLVTDRPFALSKGGQRGPGTGWDLGWLDM